MKGTSESPLWPGLCHLLPPSFALASSYPPFPPRTRGRKRHSRSERGAEPSVQADLMNKGGHSVSPTRNPGNRWEKGCSSDQEEPSPGNPPAAHLSLLTSGLKGFILQTS